MTTFPEGVLPTCEFGKCLYDATCVLVLRRPLRWRRKACYTHALDFQAGAVRLSVPELCRTWDAGKLKVDRPICGIVNL